MGRLKQETISGAKWALIRKLTLQPVQFVFGMVLARLISPAEMGVLGLTAIFFAVASSLKEAGIGAALIRKQDRTEADINTVFWYNMAANSVFALAFWFIAPWFADFFHQPDLLWLTRISACMTLLNGTAGVHYTLYTARRDFKTPAIIGIITTLVSMPPTLYLAYIGWSYWAMMMQGVISGLLSLTIIWIVSPWKPRFMFSMASLREFFSFGIKIALSGLVFKIYDESRNFVIGKFYSPAQLAFYGRASSLCQLPTNLLQGPVDGIIYPILSTIQDDTAKLDRVYRQYMRLCLCPNLWIMLTVAFNAPSVIHLLYGETWLPCALYVRLLCFAFAFSSIIRVNFNYLMVKGRSDLMLQREIILRSFGITAMLIGAYFSVAGICIAFIISNLLNVILTVTYTLKISDMTAKEQFSDYYPYLLMTLAANIPSLLLDVCGVPFYVAGLLGPALAGIIYWVLLHRLRDSAYILIWGNVTKSGAWLRIRRIFPLLNKLEISA